MTVQSLSYKNPPSSYSRGSYSLLQPSNRIYSQDNILTMPRYGEDQYPAAPTGGQYLAPSPDITRIRQLTHQTAGPSLRRLRSGLTGILQEASRSENPNIEALLKRRALEGYGQGTEDIMGGAQQRGMQLYQPEYAADVDTEKMRYLQTQEQVGRDYEMLLKKYFDIKPKYTEPTYTEPTYTYTSPTHAEPTSTKPTSTKPTYDEYPSVNPAYWTNWLDQQYGIRMSEETGRPLSDFYTTVSNFNTRISSI